MEEANFQTEPAMSVTESVSSFSEFSHVYSSCTTLTHELARLFDKCEFDKEETISFKEATKRLRIAVDNSISAVEISTKRKVSEFRIGKTYVKSQLDRTFDPMQPMTWGTIGGTNMKWGTHKKDNYDGLIEVGCVTNELIPKDIKEANTAIDMGHQMYALVMTQSLVHHYMVQKPNGKLRNKSFDIGYCSEEKTENKGSIIYIAYKLESEKISEVDDLVIKEEEQEVRTATIESLKKKLEEEEELHFRGSIPDDGNSFFKACSDQLQLLEISGHTHTELRQMVIPNFQFYTENEIKSANFTRDTWKIYIDKVAEDNENVEDIVVEAMAKLLRRQIIIYSLNSTKEISTTIINEDANETPLLLAKYKLYYQSLDRRTSKREKKERIDMERKINEERIYKEMIEKDRDIEIEERERMLVDISSSGAMGKEDSNMLYRLLRPDERCEVGLRAKNPNSTVSVFDHVISGTWGQQSKYISTCGSWEALNSFRSKSTDSGRIAKIQKDKLPSSVEIIDLRRQENRNHYIDHDRDAGSINKFNNFANKFQKVLLVGHVPEACVELCDD